MPSRDEILHFGADAPEGASPWVVEPVPAAIELVDSQSRWASDAQEVGARVSAALGLRALRVEHVGSTAVEGLPAKPIIDLDVTVADPSREGDWLPLLEAAGYVLTVREPWWHEHRMLRGGRHADDRIAPTDGGVAANIHIFGPDSAELVKHVVFRNWLRANEADRELYARAKREAAAMSNRAAESVMQYNARKQAVIRQIYQRAFRAAGFLD